MTKLAGDAYVYYNGGVIAPGDELPDELAHLGSDAPAETGGETGATDSATEVNGAAVNPEFDVEKATVPELRDELTRLSVDFDRDDRKDALQAKYREATSA